MFRLPKLPSVSFLWRARGAQHCRHSCALTAKTFLVPPDPRGAHIWIHTEGAAPHSMSCCSPWPERWAAGAAPQLKRCQRRPCGSAWQTDAVVALAWCSQALCCATRCKPGWELRAGRASVDRMHNDDGRVMRQGLWHTSIQTTRLSSSPEEKFNRRRIGRRSWGWAPQAVTPQDGAGHHGHGWSQAAELAGRHRGAVGLCFLLLSFIPSEPACFSQCQAAHQPVPGAWVGKTSRNLFHLSFQMFPCQPAAVQRLCELMQYLPPFNLSYRMQNHKTLTANSAAARNGDPPARAALPFLWGIISERGEKPLNTARLLRASQTSHVCLWGSVLLLPALQHCPTAGTTPHGPHSPAAPGFRWGRAATFGKYFCFVPSLSRNEKNNGCI